MHNEVWIGAAAKSWMKSGIAQAEWSARRQIEEERMAENLVWFNQFSIPFCISCN